MARRTQTWKPGLQEVDGWPTSTWGPRIGPRPTLVRLDGSYWLQVRLKEPWDTWTVAGRLVLDDRGVLVVAELRVRPANQGTIANTWEPSVGVPRGGMPSALIRKGIALTDIQRIGDYIVQRVVRLPGLEGHPEIFQPSNQRGRPPKWRQQDYAKVALAYDRGLRKDSSPVQSVMQRLDVGESVARNLIAGARRRKLLFAAAKQGAKSSRRLSAEERKKLVALVNGKKGNRPR